VNKKFYLGILLSIALLTSACGSAATAAGTSTPEATATSASAATQTSAGLGFNAAPWQNGSKVSYEWFNDKSDTQIGTSQYSFALRNNVWTISEQDKIGELNQTAEMMVNAKTLEPIGEKKTIKKSNTNADITTSYKNGKLDISAVVNGKTTNASIDVPSNAIDNDQLLMTLEALPFAKGYKANFVVIVAQDALKVNTTVTVLSQEKIDVPAGSFETWHVEIQAGQSKQNAWYQVAAPHALVQYDNGTNRMRLSK
jgi:hypothetical protein